MEPRDRKLVAALAGALGCALLAIAFLLGRMSAKPERTAAVKPVESAPAAAPSAVTGSSPIRDPTPRPSGGAIEAATADAPAQVPAAPGREDTRASAPAPSASLASPERPQIAAYFAQFERLDDVGAGDPQAFATSMLQSVTSGDFSGFDDLLAKARSQRDRLRSLSPPRVCAEHHRLSLALSGDSVTMLERLKAALMRGDSTALMTMAAEGRALETQANQLKAMGEAIKRQAGL